jgi:serine/threonine-protein kinase HipA
MAHEEDIATFIDALILNWLIGGTDAHGKNYSILIGGGGLVRLAPLYDIASIFAYPAEINADKARLAMKIGKFYELRDIGLSAWRKFAADLRIDPDALVERARTMATELPDRLSGEVRRLREDGITHVVIDNLAKALPERAARAARM